jgi:hypothetical protein
MDYCIESMELLQIETVVFWVPHNDHVTMQHFAWFYNIAPPLSACLDYFIIILNTNITDITKQLQVCMGTKETCARAGAGVKELGNHSQIIVTGNFVWLPSSSFYHVRFPWERTWSTCCD